MNYGYVHMSCCGGVLGEHAVGCEDAISPDPDVWPALRDGNIVWLTAAEEAEGHEIHHASEREAYEHLERSA